jgi:hypothetical protein
VCSANALVPGTGGSTCKRGVVGSWRGITFASTSGIISKWMGKSRIPSRHKISWFSVCRQANSNMVSELLLRVSPAARPLLQQTLFFQIIRQRQFREPNAHNSRVTPLLITIIMASLSHCPHRKEERAKFWEPSNIICSFCLTTINQKILPQSWV